MKKLFYMAAIGLMISACSREDVPAPGLGNLGEPHDVTIDFDLNVSAGAETRAGRDLWSQQALQEVNQMTVYIFEKDKGYIKSVPITGFAADESAKKNHGYESHSEKVAERLPNGEYIFLAVGMDAGKDVYKELALTPATESTNGTLLADAVLELKSATSNATHEVFSGMSSVNGEYVTITDDTKNISVNITVNRAVAGVLGYFKNVPYELPDPENDTQMLQVKKISVELISYGTKIKLNTRSKVDQAAYLYKPLMSLDLTTIGKGKDANSNIWTRDAITSETASFTVAENSFLMGAFVLPFDKDNSATDPKGTIRVALYGQKMVEGKNVDVFLKEYRVKCNNADHVGSTVFDVKANEFYSLGIKKYNNTVKPKPEPSDPTDPDPTPDPTDPTIDNPIDLSKDDIITVTVNPRWSVIHELDIID